MVRIGRKIGRYSENEPKPAVIIIAFALLLAVLGLAAASTISKVRQPDRDVLIVGTNTPFPPFEMRKGEEVVGFDIDLAKLIAEALERKLVLKDFGEFDALLPAVESGSLDIAISSITIRDDRKEVVSFSDAYFESAQAILTTKKSPLVYAGDPAIFYGLRVGYQEGTTSQFWVEEFVKNASLIPFGDLSVGLQLLTAGSVDVVVLDEPAAVNFAKANHNLRVAGKIETGEEYGVVVAKGDPKKLLPAINQVIKEMRETGEYDQLVDKWFGGANK